MHTDLSKQVSGVVWVVTDMELDMSDSCITTTGNKHIVRTTQRAYPKENMRLRDVFRAVPSLVDLNW